LHRLAEGEAWLDRDDVNKTFPSPEPLREAVVKSSRHMPRIFATVAEEDSSSGLLLHVTSLVVRRPRVNKRFTEDQDAIGGPGSNGQDESLGEAVRSRTSRIDLQVVRFNGDADGYDPAFGGHGSFDTGASGAYGMPCSAAVGLGPYTAVVLLQNPA
jgi:hypothetical protein